MPKPARFSFRSIRAKMTLAAVAPLLLILLLVTLAASYLINASIVKQTQKQIRNDLNAARVVLEQEQQRLRDVVRFTAQSSQLLSAMRTGDRNFLPTELAKVRQQEGLDVLNLTDQQGRMLFPQGEVGITPVANFVSAALQSGRHHAIVLLDETEMRRESSQLAKRALIFRPGESVLPQEQRGMFLLAAVRLTDRQGEPLGCLYGGILLNNNLPLVDRINELVYSQDKFDGIAVGSATIFLGELRVATTIRLKNGERAIGTQVSREVADAVLQRGEIWLDRAQVVEDWYLTAYEPIVDERQRSIGALYVGMLEKPLVALKQQALLTLFGLLLFGCLLGGLLASYLARRISSPVMELADSAEQIAAGERDVLLPEAGQDEVGHLTQVFAEMTEALKTSDLELQTLNRKLEQKVEERTSQLEEKSLQLIKTQEQLLRHEKLAAIGSLATGVAHEINNPAAIIRGNVEILQMSLPENAPEQEEAAEIMKQVERVSLITGNLLSFAGRQDLKSEQVRIDLLLEEILAQISHQQPLGQVRIDRQFDGIPPVPGDRERLRQVFTNIILNALQAMAGEGTLSLSGHCDDTTLMVRISDTGPGVAEEQKEKIFNPFFTTRKRGTGLGLSVSYGIVRAHEGVVELLPKTSPGACFQVSLPL